VMPDGEPQFRKARVPEFKVKKSELGPELQAPGDDCVGRLRRRLPFTSRSRGFQGGYPSFASGDTVAQYTVLQERAGKLSHMTSGFFGGSTGFGFTGMRKISRSSASSGGGHGKPGYSALTNCVRGAQFDPWRGLQRRILRFTSSPSAMAPTGFPVSEFGQARD
jgi:hypothetical protein